jgi:NH3-dependent NAD+ synthetase
MANKVKLELTPYNAMAILKFCREFINDETKCDYRYKAIQDAVDEYEQQIYDKVSEEQLDDAIAENEVNHLIGKWPG